MIIAVVWSFGTGAAVMALGSTATTGTSAATTTVTKRVANVEPTGTEPAEFAPKKSDFEIGSKFLRKRASAREAAVSATASSRNMWVRRTCPMRAHSR
jgi:hypothetical protein